MMKLSKLFAALCILFALTAFLKPVTAQEGTWPRTVTDGAGNKITLNTKPTRIMSATLASDEILLAMVDPSRLIGVTGNSADPAQSNVADAAKGIQYKVPTPVDPEGLVAQKPDLVIV